MQLQGIYKTLHNSKCWECNAKIIVGSGSETAMTRMCYCSFTMILYMAQLYWEEQRTKRSIWCRIFYFCFTLIFYLEEKKGCCQTSLVFLVEVLLQAIPSISKYTLPVKQKYWFLLQGMQSPQISTLKKHRLLGRGQGRLPAFKPVHFHLSLIIRKLQTNRSAEI